MNSHSTRISVVPLTAGILLFAGACALLCEDALHGHWHLNHLLQPLLMLGTIVSGVLAHHRIMQLRISGVAFAFLALMGSSAVIYSSLARTATARDAQAAEALASGRQIANMNTALADARALAKQECRIAGPRCVAQQERVDKLIASMSTLRGVAVDPRSEAIGKLSDLFGMDGARVRAIASAIDPIVLPLFLEAGCILFFAAAFPHRRKPRAIERNDGAVLNCVPEVKLAAPNQVELARQWGCHPSTAGRRLKRMEAAGQVQRVREGRAMIALPGPGKVERRRAAS